MLFDIEECTPNVVAVMLLKAIDDATNEVPEVNLLRVTIFDINSKFSWLEGNATGI